MNAYLDEDHFSHYADMPLRLVGVGQPEALLRIILEAVVELFAAEGCSNALIDEHGQ